MAPSREIGGQNLGSADMDDAKAFNRGKGRVLAAMIASLVAAIAALAWYLMQNRENEYAELGKRVNGLRSQYFDGFLVCALPGSKVNELKSDAQLRDELHGRGGAGARYAGHLRNNCSPSLRELEVQLRALIAPESAKPLIQGMVDGTSKMRAGVEAYASHLEGLSEAYVREAAEPELEGLTRGWYEFRKAHVEFNKTAREQLGR
jgi:hypothetical protein